MSAESPWEWKAPGRLERLSALGKPGYALTGCSLAVCGSVPILYGMGTFSVVATALSTGLIGTIAGIGIFGILHSLHWVTIPIIVLFIGRNFLRHRRIVPLALGIVTIPMTYVHDLPVFPDNLFDQSSAVIIGNVTFDTTALLLYAGSVVLAIAIILNVRAKKSISLRNPFLK